MKFESTVVPSAYIESHSAKEPNLKDFGSSKVFSSLEEMHKYALFELGNTKFGPDGRTYVEIDDSGRYISRFVSQYSNIIDKNVEPNIRGVVKALHSRGYLTYGSCQGHSDDKTAWRRWFGVCFASETSRETFIQALEKSGLPLSFNRNVANHDLNEKNPGLKLNLTYQQNVSKENLNTKATELELTKYWNIMFCRNYSKYYPVAVGVACDVHGETTWTSRFIFFLKRRNLAQITDQLEKCISALPDYYDF